MIAWREKARRCLITVGMNAGKIESIGGQPEVSRITDSAITFKRSFWSKKKR
jgi:hypothetical protein